ncbi:LemA family protein [Chamaesiphon sp. GL140_3_metabinner_50]|uniref:LemA family protein n=1 Tax=Chamaesiphon sp. GL140_3_metabinner_50 TaxID=2970812 RepID=UPI0025EEC541|nr:LemA family protein [Chamaesiphon sp. GL140_3_metabinner_50]
MRRDTWIDWRASSRAARDPGAPAQMQSLSEAEGALTGALGRLFAVSESYPDLQADGTMMQFIEPFLTKEIFSILFCTNSAFPPINSSIKV